MNVAQSGNGATTFPQAGNSANQIKTPYTHGHRRHAHLQLGPPARIGISISEPLYSGTNYYNNALQQPAVPDPGDNVTEWYGDPQGDDQLPRSSPGVNREHGDSGGEEPSPCRRKHGSGG